MGLPSPRRNVSAFGDFENGNQNLLKNIARSLYKIRHWQFKHADYLDAPNIEATWFIDPPYFKGGEHYIHNTKDLDFVLLA